MAKIIKKGDFMKKKSPKMHNKLIFDPVPGGPQPKLYQSIANDVSYIL